MQVQSRLGQPCAAIVDVLLPGWALGEDRGRAMHRQWHRPLNCRFECVESQNKPLIPQAVVASNATAALTRPVSTTSALLRRRSGEAVTSRHDANVCSWCGGLVSLSETVPCCRRDCRMHVAVSRGPAKLALQYVAWQPLRVRCSPHSCPAIARSGLRCSTLLQD